MLLAFYLLATALGQEDELLRVFMAPSSWAAAVSRLEGHSVKKQDVAAVGCVGLVMSDMYCTWKRRKENKWRKYSGRADLSRSNDPQLKSATPE